MSFFRRNKNIRKNTSADILRDINAVLDQLRKNEYIFNRTSDPLLTEALVYEQKALRLRYSYLISVAKEMQLEVEPFGFSE